MNVTKSNNKRKEARNKKVFLYDAENIRLSEEYLNYLETRELEKSTIYHLYRNTVVIISYFERENILLKSLNAKSIEIYFKSLTNYSRFYKKTRARVFRKFLKWLFIQSYISTDLSLYVPSIGVSSYNRLPSIINDEDIQKIFNAVDRNTTSGKFNYILLLLIIRYGIRIADIKNLKFENINWKKKEINIIQTKTKVGLTLPLLDDVSDGLVDYIKNARTVSNERYIFVDVNGQKYSMTYNFYNRFQVILRQANIDLPKDAKKGIYSLRHSFASRLLKENIPLPIITSITGHLNTMCTLNYIKIDLNQLSKCCLEVPNEK